jgi:phage gp36-like protein
MYATKQDMIDRFGLPRMVQLTDLAEPLTGTVVDAVVTARLADAGAEIDGHLAGRMAVPLVAPPAIVKLLCIRLAYAALLGATASEADLADAKAARDYLRAIAEGRISLTAPDAVPAATGAGAVLWSAGEKVMGREAA